MAFGHGGARLGAGVKPQDRAAARLHGSRQRGEKGKPTAPAPALQAAKQIPRPAGLSKNVRKLWKELAPLATAARTLTLETRRAFVDMLVAIDVRTRVLLELELAGFTYTDGFGNPKAHPLLVQYRGLMVRVETSMRAFRIAPMGKEMIAEEAPADPFAEFDRHDAPTKH